MAKKCTFSPATIDGLRQGLLLDSASLGLAIEVLGTGKKRWRFRRQVAGKKVVATMFGGLYPTISIAAARDWARSLNEFVEAGTDPREGVRAEKSRATMTVGKAHELYMVAVRQGRSSRAKRVNKPRTIKDKWDTRPAPKLVLTREPRRP